MDQSIYKPRKRGVIYPLSGIEKSDESNGGEKNIPDKPTTASQRKIKYGGPDPMKKYEDAAGI